MMKIIFLAIVLTVGLTSCNSNDSSSYIPEKPRPSGTDPLADAKNFGDITRDKDSYDSALLAITRDLGYSVLKTKNYPYKSDMAVADLKPWSSWWYPRKDPELFQDTESDDSPLKKYDLVRQDKNPDAGSAVNEERQFFNPNSSNWEGLCDAWAIASISRPEPRIPVTVTLSNGDEVTFSIADLKALLLKTFEAVDDAGFKYYGQKFTGDSKGWIYPDVFPEQFHRFLEIELFQNKRAFIMDHDPGFQVWNVPVYKANYTMDSIPGQLDAVFVRTWVYAAASTSANEKSFVGTKETVREYNYVLQGTRDQNGDLIVQSGYWVKGPNGIDSRKDHPDFLIQLVDPKILVRKSWNSEIDIQLVDEILEKSYAL